MTTTTTDPDKPEGKPPWENYAGKKLEVEFRDGSHWDEIKEYRTFDKFTRGDRVWFILGHILLLPLALAVLALTTLSLPLYAIWMLYRRNKLHEVETHGEVIRMMIREPGCHPSFFDSVKDDAQPDISVIMPLYNRAHFVDWAIGGVLRQHVPEGWCVELVAVDNGSTDETVEKLKQYPVRIVHCAERGPGAARNAGLKAARGRIVLFTDSDCVGDSLWLTRLAEPLLEDDEMRLVGGEILSMQVDGNAASFANEAQVLHNWRFFSGGPYFPRFFATANLGCRRDDALKIGGFDNNLWMSEDADFCWRLLNLGGKMRFQPQAVIYHQHRLSLRHLFRQSIDYGAASVSIFAKHRDSLDTRWAIACPNIRAIAWAPFNIICDQFTAETPYDRKHEIIYCLWRLGFTFGSIRESIRKKVLFI